MSDLPAGRALDVRVAEAVFGLTVTPDWPCYTDPDTRQRVLASSLQEGLLEETGLYTERDAVYRTGQTTALGWVQASVPPYSTDVNAAWAMVEHLRAQGWLMMLYVNEFATSPWDCRWYHGNDKRAIGHGSTAPLAICRAALAALEVPK